jgi:two-component system sensor kinase FixL
MDSVRSRPAVPWVVAAFTAAALVGLGVNAASFFATHSGANLATTALLRTATLVSTLKDAETGIRGYLLTGNDAYLEPYNHAVATFDAQLSQARAALGDDAGWLGRLERIDKLSRETLSKVRDTLQAHSFQGSTDARAIADLSEGKALMDAIRSEASGLEQDILRKRQAAARRESCWVIGGAILALSGSALAGAILASLAIKRGRALQSRERSIEGLLQERASSEFDRLLAGILPHALPIGVIIADTTGRIVRANGQAARIWGGALPSTGSIEGTNMYDGWSVETGERLRPEDWAMARALSKGENSAGEPLRIRRFDGSIGTILNSAAPVLDAHGQIRGAIAVFQDITARQEAQERLIAAEARYRSIVDTAVDAIATIDEKGLVRSFNRAAERSFGYSAAEVIGHNVRILMPDRYAREHDLYIGRYLATGERRIIGIGREVVGQRKDGSEFPIELAVAEWRANGERQFTGLMRDITERKRAEAELRESEQRFRSIFTESPLGKAVVGADLRLLKANPALCRILDRPLDAILGSSIVDLMHPDNRERAVGEAGEVLTGSRPRTRFETRFLTANGVTVWASVNLARVHGSDGELMYTLAVIEDITEHKNAAAALRESEHRVQELQAEFLHVSRLSEIGQMATTLAHELNQPLAAAANYLNASRRLAAAEDPAANLPRIREALGLAAKESVRAGRIIRRMRSFVTRGDTDKRIEDIPRLLEEASELALMSARQNGVELRLDIDPDTPPVLADRVQIQQVVLNLVRNAIEAMASSDRKVVTIQSRSAEPDQVEIAVSDTGSGISEEIANDLFKPFVSTKASGMGVGLSICRTIVEAHGGRIRADPGRDGGAVFSFALPAVPRLEHNDPCGAAQ